ncbi:MAG: class I SAM-dependent methyltransferase [Planctomycetia bacterium]|nr:class I SAM-dependent methyltransferase [Planctomycetia bacterium]
MSKPLADRGWDLKAGDHHYRAFVGPPRRFDLLAARQFNLLTSLGLREHHTLLDIGCGSCRAGRLFMPYLLSGHYFGLEPEQWLVEQGIEQELGQDILRVKAPTFVFDTVFSLSRFGRTFDFLLAQSIFSHTSERQLRRCLSQARQVMKRNAIFAANFKAGRATTVGATWTYPGCVTLTWRCFRDIVTSEGLACVPLRWPHPSPSWVVIVPPGCEQLIPDPGRPGGILSFSDAPVSGGTFHWLRLAQRVKGWLNAARGRP